MSTHDESCECTCKVTTEADAEVLASLPDPEALSARVQGLCNAIAILKLALPYPAGVPAGFERMAARMLFDRFCEPHNRHDSLGDHTFVRVSRLAAACDEFYSVDWLPGFEWLPLSKHTGDTLPDAVSLANLLAAVVNEIRALEVLTEDARETSNGGQSKADGYAKALARAVADLVWNPGICELRDAVLDTLRMLPKPSVPLADGLEAFPEAVAEDCDDIPW